MEEFVREYGAEDEVKGEWRKLHNAELCYLYPHELLFGDQVKKEMGRACSTCGGEERCIQGHDGNLKETAWNT
jgi:hypothetical protein